MLTTTLKDLIHLEIYFLGDNGDYHINNLNFIKKPNIYKKIILWII